MCRCKTLFVHFLNFSRARLVSSLASSLLIAARSINEFRKKPVEVDALFDRRRVEIFRGASRLCLGVLFSANRLAESGTVPLFPSWWLNSIHCRSRISQCSSLNRSGHVQLSSSLCKTSHQVEERLTNSPRGLAESAHPKSLQANQTLVFLIRPGCQYEALLSTEPSEELG